MRWKQVRQRFHAGLPLTEVAGESPATRYSDPMTPPSTTPRGDADAMAATDVSVNETLTLGEFSMEGRIDSAPHRRSHGCA